jgi:hypothetical protein
MAVNWSTLTGSKDTEGSLANWVNRSDLPATNILLEAEAWIYQHLRVREMMTRTTLTVAEAAQSVALPDDFLDPITWTIHGDSYPLDYMSEDKLQESRDPDGVLVTGAPNQWAIIGSTIYVNCLCSQEQSGIFLYYARPEALSASNETNFLTIKYPTLLRHACMAAAYEHMKDTGRAEQWMQTATLKLAEAKATADLVRRGQNIPA